MNIALGAILLVLLLTPGAIIIRGYYSSWIEKKNNIHIPFSDLLFKGIVFSIIYHSVAICLINYVGFIPDFHLLYHLIIGKDIDQTSSDLNSAIRWFFTYYLFSIIICLTITKFFKKIIQSYNWDLKYNAFKNTNYWFELFSARKLEQLGIQGKQIDTTLIYVDVLTDKGIIYSGFLSDFNYSPIKDELENVVLQHFEKRSFEIQNSQEKKIDPNGRFHTTGTPLEFPGDALIVPASQIININIHYLNVFKIDPAK